MGITRSEIIFHMFSGMVIGEKNMYTAKATGAFAPLPVAIPDMFQSLVSVGSCDQIHAIIGEVQEN